MAALLSAALLLFYLSVCRSQRDCTGVECPLLDNCIEEALEPGSCCASCLQKGCTCEGYQFYDCLNAGFKNGKVPERDSYFVDYGSTECSCPEGGGRISCSFISCPDLPPNCIEVSQPADGCVQCERLGCVQGAQKYEAGHSFHVDACRVCHCPDQGGQLMCYPLPECDPSKAREAGPDGPAEEVSANAHDRYLDQQSQDQFPKLYRLPNGNLPLFKPLDKEEPDDYYYNPTDFPETYPQSLVFPTQPSFPEKVISRSFDGPDRAAAAAAAARHSSDRQNKLELREQYGSREQPADGEEVTEMPPRAQRGTVSPPARQDTTASWHSSQALTSDPSVSFGDHHHRAGSDPEDPLRTIVDSLIFPLNKVSGGDRSHMEQLDNVVSQQQGSETESHSQKASDGLTVSGSDSQAVANPSTRQAENQTSQQRHFDPVTFPLLHPLSPVHPQASPDARAPWLGVFTPHHQEEPDEETSEEDETVTSEDGPWSEGGTGASDAKPERSLEQTDSTSPATNYEETTSSGPPSQPQDGTTTAVPHLTTTTTTQPPPGLQLEERPSTSRPVHRLFELDNDDDQREPMETEDQRKETPFLTVKPEGAPGGSAQDLLRICCAAGQTWAAEKHHCDRMPVLSSPDPGSICSVSQKQCCLSSLKEEQCESGMAAARAGHTCHAVEEDHCSHHSHQVCCSCCALGIGVRAEGRGCDAHQYLGYPCGHVFLTCCEEEEGHSQLLLRRRQKPRATAMPKRVSDGSKFPKQALSVSAEEEAAAAAAAAGTNALQEEERHREEEQCQLCQHTCTNIWGSYRCGCHQGYQLQPDGHSCAPVSPEEDNRLLEEDVPAAVPTQTTTTTTSPTTSSSTSSSTSTTASSLVVEQVPHNPCAGRGPCSQRCTVAAGGRPRCSCFPGFSLMADGRTCADVDECASEAHSCRAGQRCVNTVGSFVCEPQVSCPPGFRQRSGVCEDVDECALRTHDCGPALVCHNTAGSFLCKPKPKCISGFAQDSHGNCIDINECSSLSAPCGSGYNCINTVGSFTCQLKTVSCNSGYQASADGARCVDLDECQTGKHQCGVGQICHNLPGSYRCDCQSGYQYDSLRKVCNDINECWRFSGRLCAQSCENTPGSYRCTCTAGFSLAADGKNCEDVNECDKNPCNQECANIYGSYQCYCRQGFYLKEDGHTCEDIDECSQSLGTLCSFRCVNVAGSYQCACPPNGYVRSANGHACRDIDECSAGSHNCSFGQSCFNLQGGFRCLSFHCPPNYKRVSDTRCERTSCPSGSLDCPKSPVRITYYQLSFQTNIVVPAQIFRIGPSPAYAGDQISIGIVRGNEEGYFSTRKLNSFAGAVFLQRQLRQPKDFLIDVEMKLLRQGSLTSFLARIYVFITAGAM